MINKIWNALIVVGIIISVFTGKINELGNVIISSATDAFDIFLNVGILILFWGGIFNIAIESGMIKNLVKVFKKPLKFIFPELPSDSLALEYVSSNIIANLLGLGSAATPLGLKAFEEMQKLNNDKKNPSRSMLTFIILNISSLTIFPTTIIGIRTLYKGETDNFLVIMMIGFTIFSTIIAFLLDRLFYHIDKGKKKL